MLHQPGRKVSLFATRCFKEMLTESEFFILANAGTRQEKAQRRKITGWTLAFAGVTDLIIESSPSARAGCLRLIDRSRQTQIFLSTAATGSMVMQFFLQPHLYQRLVWDIPRIGSSLDSVKQMLRQAQRYRFGSGLQVG
jgi:hypothetical protein